MVRLAVKASSAHSADSSPERAEASSVDLVLEHRSARIKVCSVSLMPLVSHFSAVSLVDKGSSVLRSQGSVDSLEQTLEPLEPERQERVDSSVRFLASSVAEASQVLPRLRRRLRRLAQRRQELQSQQRWT